MKNIIIIGAGKGGSALLNLLVEAEELHVVGVSDVDEQAEGMVLARKLGINTTTEWKKLLTPNIDVVLEATGDKRLLKQLKAEIHKHTTIMPSSVASLLFTLMNEKEKLISDLKKSASIQSTILNSTEDGMIAIDTKCNVTLFNQAAEKISGVKATDALGEQIEKILPSSRLPSIISSNKEERNKNQILENGANIITTRVPLKNENQTVGALAVFKDVTEIEKMAEEVTNLKSIQTMLEAIIQSTDDAISVVDENGNGLMINRAYTRLTGLQPEEVIGKPATADISEGESMHMYVLQTRKPVRGVRLKVGPHRRDVVVNVAPVIVDGQLKGSIAIVHDMSEMKKLAEQLERAKQRIRTLEAKYTFDDIIGQSEEMKLAIQQAKLAASTPATILLRGESGTGKELFAHAIHNESERKYSPFIRVNCAALSESLLESELFGYEEGAFSGAKRGGKRGLFEEAHKGSIFLDEIGELAVGTQAKLLRVLQEHEIVRVGGTKAISIDVRVICATNVNLEKAINEKTFREDLYYRINKMPIYISPLRERKGDIAMLADRLLKKLNQDYGRNVEKISDEVMMLLKKHNWPGNVRELENVIGRALIYMNYSDDEILTLPDFHRNDNKQERTVRVEQQTASLSSLVEQFEKQVILETLDSCQGNKTATAKKLQLSIRNLYYKMEKYNL
ncbi:sigma-54-dependent Fis family transcriptional regulator [Alkalihalobacillus sp. LMS39]|uniref:sigma-54 interaction domain-containing protein n=1 Tax=Alkalihalobacillus sp. LMS39 TaxID=2924032 RepID=UPI001FB30F95|nr:sigma-54-dependent Fis family transcriptional regulator [Alkalihalobacillus sp. LMS39]UOE95949.1 sigma-54-dependent Fis family transcriptional regulator [Alkalihalobacillus sp. LMS39]